MSNHSPNEYVAAGDLQPGDRILYAGMVVLVAGTGPASWTENGERMHGVEVSCTDAGGTARLFLYRTRDHQFERIRPAGGAS